MPILDKKYELIENVVLNELKGNGYFYRHKKSHASVIVIKNDDKNKVFSACFPTPVTNSKGIPHILEHSVLCGSRKYPLKDPFVELMKGSMNTFLNAMTFDDMTLYPVASCHDKDFKNLMDIYLDAVFYPNVLKRKEIFMQEGWHYEIDDNQLYYNGVVYNEMKGYMASPDYILEQLIKESLYPNSCYSYHSGGKPEDIVHLDYQELLDFYYQHYHPSKCLLFIYGDIDIEERLEYLDENYLSQYEALNSQDKPFNDNQEPLTILTGDYDCHEDYTYFAYNTIFSTHHDLFSIMAIQLLDYILVSSPGAFIRQALLNENIGQDIYSSMATNIHHPFYSIICMNAKAEEQERFFEIVEKTIQDIMNEDIDEKMILAALHSLQFKYREQEFGSTPKGLYHNQQLLMRWIYHEDHVFDMLQVQDTLHTLEHRIYNHEFKDIVKELMVHPHSQVCLYPQAQLQLKNDELENQILDEIYGSLNDEQKQDIVEDYEQLMVYQETPESKDVIDCIPILEREDLPKEVQKSINEKIMIEEIPLFYHELPTTGIGYLKLSFDLRTLPLELLPYASLLNSFLGMIDTQKRDYLDFFNDIVLTTGGIYHRTYIYDGTLGNGEIRPSYEIDAKMLYNEIENVENLICEEICESCFDKEQRMIEILIQEKASLQSQFMDSAHIIALNESKKNQSMVEYYMNQMDYMGYYQFICDLLENFNHHHFVEKMRQTMKFIFNKNHLVVSYTGERESLAKMKDSIKHLCQCLSQEYRSERIFPEVSLQSVHQAYMIPSQVQYVAMSGNIQNMPIQYLSAYELLLHILRCDYLWYHVRVRGGAYGCFTVGENHQILSIVSYRDPHLKETLEIYSHVLEYVKEFDVSEREMLQYIIGAISERERPLSSQQIGNISFSRVICGIDEIILNQLREQMIEVQSMDIQKLFPYIEQFTQDFSYCVVGNEKMIHEQKELFDEIKSLIN